MELDSAGPGGILQGATCDKTRQTHPRSINSHGNVTAGSHSYPGLTSLHIHSLRFTVGFASVDGRTTEIEKKND